MSSVEACATRDEIIADFKILAPIPDVVSDPEHAIKDKIVAIARAMFLHQDSVGAFWDRCSREDPGCMTWGKSS